MKNKKYKKGYTLVETIVVLAISAIIFIGMLTVYQAGNNLALSGDRLAQAQNIAKSVAQTLEGVLKYANNLDIQNDLPDNVSNEYNYVYTTNGGVQQMYWGESPEPLMSGENLKNYTYTAEFKKIGEEVVNVVVSVQYGGEEVTRASSDVYLQNLMNNSVTGATEGKCICYQGTGITVTRVYIYSATTIISASHNLQMYAITLPRNASTRGVAWSVDDDTIATIDQTGLLTPIKSGYVTVTATALDGSTVNKSQRIIIVNN